jgi:hypothetical protein
MQKITLCGGCDCSTGKKACKEYWDHGGGWVSEVDGSTTWQSCSLVEYFVCGFRKAAGFVQPMKPALTPDEVAEKRFRVSPKNKEREDTLPE